MTADAGIHGHDPACDCKQCVTAQRDQLLAFTKEVMQAWPEGGIDLVLGGDVDPAEHAAANPAAILALLAESAGAPRARCPPR